MKLRIFPRRTRATPNDEWVRIGEPGLFDPPDGAYSAWVSVTFTWDIPRAERIRQAWSKVICPTYIGGPAYGDPGGDFTSGEYLAPGNVITSRGCPNHCPRCFVPQREGALRELPVRDGWLVHDNNLLACSRDHIRKVFDMLTRQPKRARFVGGFEAARVEPWLADALREIDALRVYLAYDRPGEWASVAEAVRMLKGACDLCCYVLIGYPGDTMEAAASRCQHIWDIGVMPYAMLYRDEANTLPSREWRALQRLWCRPACIRVNQRKARAVGAW